MIKDKIMSWLTQILSASTGNVIKQIGDVIDRFTVTGDEKNTFQLKMKQLLQEKDVVVEKQLSSTLQAKERILITELQQSDSYTKRARPTVVYAGLFFIFFNYSLVPAIAYLFGQVISPLSLPAAFWAGWSGIVATWSIGRTIEKKGKQNSITGVITGTKNRSTLLGD